MSPASRTYSCATTKGLEFRRGRRKVWLSSVFLKTLRDYRIPILGWGIGMGLVLISPMASVSALVTTPQAREQLVSLALFISQFTKERGPAAGWTAGLLLVFIVVDMVHRVVPNTDWISRLSPIYYYNLSKPLVPAYGANAGAMVALLAMAAILGGV